MIVATVLAAVALAIWVHLAATHGRFWRTSTPLPEGPDPRPWPPVVAVVPARDEAAVLPTTLPTLLAQDYPGPWRVIVVDDDSADGTGALARDAGAHVVRAAGPPPGWTGKVAAMARGLDAAGDAEYVLFTDADIAYPPDAVTGLVRAARARDLVLTSYMVRLRAQAGWERLIVPAFVYFFTQLYPFAWVSGPGRTAAAAGGCMLVRRDALVGAGGFAAIRDALIDDVSLARLLRPHGRLWLGHSPAGPAAVRSVRPYPRLHDLWAMVARSAYTQLRYSVVLLIATVLGLTLVYVVPPVITVLAAARGDVLPLVLAGLAWLLMTLTYVPMLRWHGVPAWRAPLLPAVAVLYAAMTVDSARRHHAGRGGAWKGRVRALS